MYNSFNYSISSFQMKSRGWKIEKILKKTDLEKIGRDLNSQNDIKSHLKRTYLSPYLITLLLPQREEVYLSNDILNAIDQRMSKLLNKQNIEIFSCFKVS